MKLVSTLKAAGAVGAAWVIVGCGLIAGELATQRVLNALGESGTIAFHLHVDQPYRKK